MKGRLEKEKRDIIPRWRSFAHASEFNEELSSVNAINQRQLVSGPDQTAQNALAEFKSDPSIWNAGDLLVLALVRDDKALAAKLAQFVLVNETEALPLILEISRDVAQIKSADSPKDLNRRNIATIKRRLELYPRDALAWADLSLELTLLGGFESADRAIRTALHLSPNNRFILRSASRFYNHQGELDRAHDIVLRADATRHDPWLLAAELAAARAAGKASPYFRQAKGILNSARVQPHHLSELASALATMEGDSPTARRLNVRRLIKQSLIDPTENSVAQAQWHSVNTGFATPSEIDVKSQVIAGVRHIYEAQAWQYYIEGDFNLAFDSALKWYEDQPFSARPAFLVSQLASLLVYKPEVAIKIAKRALRPNPKEVVLWNNLAYAQAMIGENAEARSSLEKVEGCEMDPITQLHVTATSGAIEFRSGNVLEGRRLYERAIDEFIKSSQKPSDFEFVGLAIAHLALEEAIAGSPEAQKFVEQARAIQNKVGRADFNAIVDKAIKELENKAKSQNPRNIELTDKSGSVRRISLKDKS